MSGAIGLVNGVITLLVVLRLVFVYFRDFCLVFWSNDSTLKRRLRAARSWEVANLIGFAGLSNLIWLISEVLS